MGIDLRYQFLGLGRFHYRADFDFFSFSKWNKQTIFISVGFVVSCMLYHLDNRNVECLVMPVYLS
jgi:hypothetical protein